MKSWLGEMLHYYSFYFSKIAYQPNMNDMVISYVSL